MGRLLIWGAGDQGTVTLECALAMKHYSRIDFLEIREKGSREIAGHTVYKEEEEKLSEILHAYDEVIVATGDNDLREGRQKILKAMGIPVATVVHPTAVISPSARILAGCTVLACAVINTNAVVGAGCIVNNGVIVEHDCEVGDFVNICPGAAMAGHTKIGRKAFLGIGCTMIDGIEVGAGAVIGAGAVVIRDVPDQAVAVGVPAKIIKQSGIRIS